MRSTDELWLDVLQRITGRAAHELRGALNGAGVNLEVVRSRSGKPDVAASALTSFANAASEQFEIAVAMTEAFLALGRAAREPVDVGDTVALVAALLGPVVRAGGHALRVERPPSALAATTGTQATLVRALAGGALLAAVDRTGDVVCRVGGEDETLLTIDVADAGGPLEIAADLHEAARAAGVRVEVQGQSISLAFPLVGGARRRTSERT